MLAQTFLIRYSMSVEREKKQSDFLSFVYVNHVFNKQVVNFSISTGFSYVAAHDMPFWSLGGAAFVVGPARSTRLGGFNGGFV